jgi:hypothetical protein
MGRAAIRWETPRKGKLHDRRHFNQDWCATYCTRAERIAFKERARQIPQRDLSDDDPNRCPTLIRNRVSGATKREGWLDPAVQVGGARLGWLYLAAGPGSDRKQKDWPEKAGDWQEKTEA